MDRPKRQRLITVKENNSNEDFFNVDEHHFVLSTATNIRNMLQNETKGILINFGKYFIFYILYFIDYFIYFY
jgi:hypothetical protein